MGIIDWSMHWNWRMRSPLGRQISSKQSSWAWKHDHQHCTKALPRLEWLRLPLQLLHRDNESRIRRHEVHWRHDEVFWEKPHDSHVSLWIRQRQKMYRHPWDFVIWQVLVWSRKQSCFSENPNINHQLRWSWLHRRQKTRIKHWPICCNRHHHGHSLPPKRFQGQGTYWSLYGMEWMAQDCPNRAALI